MRHLVLASLLALAPATALADDDDLDTPTEEDPEPEVAVEGAVWDRVLAVSATAGLDTPFGIGGAAIEIAPFRYLSIYAGAGVGRDGFRVAGGVRGQFPVGNGALGLMVGLTGGPLDWDSNSQNPDSGTIGEPDFIAVHRWWEFAMFIHSGISFEYRWDEGFFGRLSFGVEALVYPSAATQCGSETETCEEIGFGNDAMSSPIRGWAGLSVGYAFDL